VRRAAGVHCAAWLLLPLAWFVPTHGERLVMLRQFALVACCAAFSFSLAGCGGSLYETAEVTGTLMCGAKPAYGGVIIFRPIDDPKATGRPPGEPGQGSSATVEKDGTFRMLLGLLPSEDRQSGALIGRHQVFYEPPRTKPVPLDPQEYEGRTPQQVQEIRDKFDTLYPVFPPLACGVQIAPTEVEVKDSDNSFNFTIQ
jgi:hypothetical protein